MSRTETQAQVEGYVLYFQRVFLLSQESSGEREERDRTGGERKRKEIGGDRRLGRRISTHLPVRMNHSGKNAPFQNMPESWTFCVGTFNSVKYWREIQI